jgi:hypothetical protein
MCFEGGLCRAVAFRLKLRRRVQCRRSRGTEDGGRVKRGPWGCSEVRDAVGLAVDSDEAKCNRRDEGESSQSQSPCRTARYGMFDERDQGRDDERGATRQVKNGDLAGNGIEIEIGNGDDGCQQQQHQQAGGPAKGCVGVRWGRWIAWDERRGAAGIQE